MTRTAGPWRTVVLDAQAVSLWMASDRQFMARLWELSKASVSLVVSANTIIEVASHPEHRRLDWLVSRVRVEPVTEAVARTAAGLLRAAHVAGHTHAIDASVAATAMHAEGPTAIMTSDPDDLYRLCQGRVDLLRV